MQNNTSRLLCLFSAAVASVVGVTAHGQAYSNAVQALVPPPVAYWPLQETVTPPTYYATNLGSLGTNSYGQYGMWWQQGVGGGTNYYFTNTIVHVSPGAVGDSASSALSMQSGVTGQYVVWPRNLPGTLITGPFSVEAWVYPTNNVNGFQAAISVGRVVDYGAAPAFTDAASGFSLGEANGGPFFAIFNTNGSIQNEIDITNASYVNNTWHHLVATFDGATTTLYLDGVVGTIQPNIAGNQNNHCAANPAVPGTLGYVTNNAGHYYEPNYNDPLIIGGVLGQPIASTWQGRISEVAIYNTALSAGQVATHYAAGSGANYPATVEADNPTIYARLNEPSVNTEFSIPNGTPLTNVATAGALPVASDAGTLGAGANGYYLPGSMPGLAGPQGAGFASPSYGVGMNGMYSGVDVGLGGNLTNISALNSNLIPVSGSKAPITAIAWFRSYPSDCRNRFQGIIGRGDTGWRMALDGGEGVHWNPGPGSEAQLNGGSTAQVTVMIGATNGFFPNDGNWHMETGVSDGTSNYLYLDGRLVISAAMSAYGVSNRDVWIGGAPDYTQPNNFRTFDGAVSQVAYFTNALTTATVSNLYAAAGIAPFMSYQPLSLGIGAGYTASILAEANGSGVLNYQWYSGTPGSGSPVSGATSNTLTIPNVQSANSGSYYLVVTSVSGYGSVTSQVAALSVYTLPTTTYASAVLALNPAGYWPLQENVTPPSEYYIATNSGTFGANANGIYETYYNSIQNTFYPTMSSVIVHSNGVTGDGDPCMVTGGSQYVVFPHYTNGVLNPSTVVTAPFSLELWVFASGANTGTLIADGGAGTIGLPDLDWSFEPDENGFLLNRSASNVISLSLYQGGPAPMSLSGNGALAASGLTINGWNHVVATFDGTTELIYLNGSQSATRTFTSSQANVNGQWYVPEMIQPLLVGCGAGLNANDAAEAIDEVAIYPTALTSTQVGNHYAAVGNPAGGTSYASTVLADSPSIYLRLDEPYYGQPNPGPLPVATNYGFTGSLANGVYQPGTSPGAAGPVGSGFGGGSSSVAINGFDSAVEVGAGALPLVFNPTASGSSLTVMTWFKANPADSINRFQNIMGHSDSSWRLTMDTAGFVEFTPDTGTQLSISNNEASFAGQNDFLANNGQWHMAVGVLTSGSNLLYVDGNLTQAASGSTTIPGTPRDLFLGGDPQYLVPGGRVFDGSVAQAAYFNYALTPAQIQSLYASAQMPPVINLQPQSDTAYVGDLEEIAVGAGGASLSYKWYSTPDGTVASGTPVSPAQTTTTLTFNSLQQANAGFYFVVVSNTAGSVTSSVINLSVLNLPSGTFAQQVLALGPVGYWPLNETGGSFAYDYSGNNHDGLYSGQYQQNQSGPTISGVTAAAVNFYAQLGTGIIDIPTYTPGSDLNLKGAMTMICWFQSPPTIGNFTTYFGHSDSGYRFDNDGSGFQHFADGNGTGDVDGTYQHNIANTGWHFIVGILNGTSSTSSNFLYLDGQLGSGFLHPTAPAGSATDVYIGGDPQYGTARSSGGQICQCAVFNYALTPMEISNLYASASSIAPVISMPTNFNGNQGQSATLTALVSGGPPLAYTWWYSTTGSDSNYISGGTVTNALNSLPLTLNNVQTSQSGYTYYLYVTNDYGTIQASSVLNVFAAPTVPSGSPTPTNATLYAGYAQTFNIAANGATPLYYQWLVNNVAVTGLTVNNTNYTTATNLTAGTYSITVLISNSVGKITSGPATFNALAPATPYTAAVIPDHPVGFWPLNEGNPPGGDQGNGDDGLPAFDYAGGNNGFYTNAIIGATGFDPLDPNTSATFGVSASPNSYVGGINDGVGHINFAAGAGTNAAFSVEAWVSGFQLQNSGAAIISSGFGGGGEQFALDTGATSNGLRFYFRDAAFASHTVNSFTNPTGNIWYHVVGVLDEVHSNEVLYIDGLPVATNILTPGLGVQQPTTPVTIGAREPAQNTPYSLQFEGSIQNVAIYNYALSPVQVNNHFQGGQFAPLVAILTNQFYMDQGATATFTSVFTNGAEPMTLQWFYMDNSANTFALAGQTNVTLTLSNVQASMQGYQYWLDATNAYGTNTSTAATPATLNVNVGAPFLVTDLSPLFQSGSVGSPYTYTVTVTGQEPFTYTWYQDGQVIAGATTSAYSNVYLLGTNTYYVTVSNSYNGASGLVSSTATNVGYPGEPPLTFPPSGSNGWTINDTTAAADATPAGSNILANGQLTLTFDRGSETRDAWYNTKQDISSFLCTFTYQDLSSASAGADGVSFAVQNQALTAIGGGGGSFAYTTITPSAAFIMNIYHGADGGADSVVFTAGGTVNNAAPPFVLTAPVVLDGGDPINVSIYYNGTTAFATLTDTVNSNTISTSTNINLVSSVGNPAWVGFTGADGGVEATQQIYNFQYAPGAAPPTLSATVSGGNIVISWSNTASTLFTLQTATNLAGPWANVTGTLTGGGGKVVYTTPNAGGGTSAFYRLQLQ